MNNHAVIITANVVEEDKQEGIDRTVVTIIDITDQDDEYEQRNPLPTDSPILMVEVHPQVPDFNDVKKRCKIIKGHLLSKFSSASTTLCMPFPLYGIVTK